MEVERCISLHNEILRIGLEGSGKDANALGQSWFTRHGEHAADIRNRLSPELIAFLNGAQEVEDNHSLFYFVAGLQDPSTMFAEENSDGDRYLTLYAANDIADHPDGLIYDQETNTAIIQMTVEDQFTARNGRQRWHPLTKVLEAWLDMIRVGKVQAVHDDIDVTNPRFDPWIHIPYSDSMLQESIQAFGELVGAIELRMPNAPRGSRPDGLYHEDDLRASGIPPGFAFEFFRKAQRPFFKFIAPGLKVPTGAMIGEQPFFTVAPEPPNDPNGDVLGIQPILLFRSDNNYKVPQDGNNLASNVPFSWPYNQVTEYPSGLYLAAVDRQSCNVFEDEAKLVLSVGIGSNGFARTSDGARFGENTEDDEVEPKNTISDLYQPGYQPFVDIHGVRLVKILRCWKGMVERGDWEVDKHGVTGDADEWQKADTADAWEKFVAPIDW